MIVPLMRRIEIVVQIVFGSIDVECFRFIIAHPPICSSTASSTTHSVTAAVAVAALARKEASKAVRQRLTSIVAKTR